MSATVEVKNAKSSRNPLRGLRDANPTKLDRILRIANLLNAAFLCTAGILTFVPIPTINLLLILASLYVITFSCILCCFELHFGFIERIVYRDCGFMFRAYGRLLFFIFVGTLSFGLGVVGIAAGVYTIINVLFNLAVMHFSPTYKQFRAQQMDEYNKNYSTVREAWGSEMKELKKTVVKKAATEIVNQQLESLNSGRGGGGRGKGRNNDYDTEGGWERLLDEESGSYYYYNPQTKETRWDPPTKLDDRLY